MLLLFDDIAVNKKVNAEIIEYIKKGDARFAVSLFLYDDVNPANNHANIDFEDASKEWRRNKVKHENCWFTYTHNHE